MGLDIEATRAAIANASKQSLSEIRAQRERAEREEQSAAARLARVRRDYQDGRLDAEDWRDQRNDLTQESEAAAAAASRLRNHEAAIAEGAELQDAEESLLQYLAQLRSALAGEVTERESIEAVRSALLRLFRSFTVHRAGTIDPDSVGVEEPWVEMTATPSGLVLTTDPRPEAVQAIGEQVPVFRRQPLYPAENKSCKGFIRASTQSDTSRSGLRHGWRLPCSMPVLGRR